jgi:hypothetical protein
VLICSCKLLPDSDLRASGRVPIISVLH